MKVSKLVILPFCFLLVSCGSYSQVGGGKSTATTVQTIQSDRSGVLRNCLAEHLSESRKFVYSSGSRAKAKIVVDIASDRCDSIGYGVEVDPKTLRKGSKLFPSESNRTAVANVSVVSLESGENLVEPFSVSATLDFDYVNPSSVSSVQHFNRDKSETTVMRHSMGQLDSKEATIFLASFS